MGFYDSFKYGLQSQLDPETYQANIASRTKALEQQAAGNAYASISDGLIQAGLDPNSNEYHIKMTDAAYRSGNPFLMEKIGLNYGLAQQNAILHPSKDPNMTDDLYEIKAMGVDMNDPAAVKNAYMEIKTRTARAGADNMSIHMPNMNNPDGPVADTVQARFTKADGSPLDRWLTQKEINNPSAYGLQMQTDMTDDRAKAGMAAMTMNQYELEDAANKYGYTDIENDPGNLASYAGANVLDWVAGINPGAANAFGEKGQRANQRVSAYKYWAEMPIRVLSGATVRPDEEINFRMQYMPVQGEKPEDREQKRARRIILQNAMLEKSRGGNPAGPMFIGNGMVDAGMMNIPNFGKANVKFMPNGDVLVTSIEDGEQQIMPAAKLSSALMPKNRNIMKR